MGALEFIAQLVGSLAWPLVVLCVAVAARREIRDLIRSLRRLTYGDFAAEFRRLEETSERIAESPTVALPAPRTADELVDDLLTVSPKAAVVEAFRAVERSIVDAAERHGMVESGRRSVTNVIRDLGRRITVPPEVQGIFDDLRTVRNRLVHSDVEDVSPDDARRYIGFARTLASKMSQL